MRRPCRQVPRLPRKVLDVAKCHACHAKCRGATGDQRRPTATKRATGASPVSEVPRLPSKCDVHVAKCHAFRAKCKSMSPSATPATQSATAPRATNGDQARHRSQPSVISATPATQMRRPCRQAPRLPRRVQVNVAKRYACHAKCRGATGDQQRPSAPPEPGQCHKCHACHANATSMLPRATPATHSASQCHQVPRQDGVWQSSVWKRVCEQVVCERWSVTKLCERWCVTKLCERDCVTKLCAKDGVWQSCAWWWCVKKMVCDKVVCERECVTKLCVKESVRQSYVWKMVCDKVVCERRSVTSCVCKMVCDKVVCDRGCDKVVCERECVTKLCVKDGVWQSCVWKLAEGRGREEQAGAGAGHRIKNKNPTQRCGEKQSSCPTSVQATARSGVRSWLSSAKSFVQTKMPALQLKKWHLRIQKIFPISKKNTIYPRSAPGTHSRLSVQNIASNRLTAGSIAMAPCHTEDECVRCIKITWTSDWTMSAQLRHGHQTSQKRKLWKLQPEHTMFKLLRTDKKNSNMQSKILRLRSKFNCECIWATWDQKCRRGNA